MIERTPTSPKTVVITLGQYGPLEEMDSEVPGFADSDSADEDIQCRARQRVNKSERIAGGNRASNLYEVEDTEVGNLTQANKSKREKHIKQLL